MGTKAEVNSSRHDLAAYLCAQPTEDADVAGLCADALMAASAWDYYDGPKLKTFMQPAWDILRRDVSPNRSPHPLSLHLFIHIAEPSKYQMNNPLIGQLAADALDGMIPGAGHLNHMVAHIYQQVGRFAAGAAASKRAQNYNDAYLKNCLSPYGMGHNLHVGIFNAVASGQRATAIGFALRQITAANDHAEVGVSDRSEPQSRVSPFSANLALVHLRFGRWADATKAANWEGACGAKCITEFSNKSIDFRAHRTLKQMVIAFANEAAGKSSDAQSAVIGLPPHGLQNLSMGSFAESFDRRPKIAIIAAQLELSARRAYTRGDVAHTVAALRNLSSFLEAQPYMEPDFWYYDPRECLGYVLQTQGVDGVPDPAAALETYVAALKHRPRTPWALIGAAQATDALTTSTAANPYELQFQAAMKDADTMISSPCPQYASKAPLTTRSLLRR